MTHRLRIRKMAYTALAALALWSLQGGLLSGRGGLQAAPQPASRAEEIARYFRCPVQDVDLLRNGGMGYGEIVKVMVISQMSGRPLKTLLAQNSQGYGWGTISRQLKLDVIEVTRQVERARADLKIRVRQAKP